MKLIQGTSDIIDVINQYFKIDTTIYFDKGKLFAEGRPNESKFVWLMNQFGNRM